MVGTRPPKVPRARRRLGLVCTCGALAALALCAPRIGLSELRPLVREMLENLSAVNDVGRGVALENYDLVQRAADDLKQRSIRLRDMDLSTLGLDPQRDTQFDAYLTLQREAAEAIGVAAKAEDGQAVLLGVQQLFENSCLACHADFREGNRMLKPSVMFMTTFMNAWTEINRGLSINDYALISRSAREVQAMGRVLSWDQVIESTFGLKDAKRRQEFRRHLLRLIAQAEGIEQAAASEDARALLKANRLMWQQGCLACHEQFR